MNDISRNTKYIKTAVLLFVLTALLFLSGCQELFTTSLMEGLQRDPSNLPPEQQVSYAESALASGDTAAMAEAYDIIDDLADSDPELHLLAADLAMGASGITDVMDDAIADPASFTYPDDLAGVDTSMLANVADHVLSAENAGLTGITEEQYVAAAGAMMLASLQEVDGSVPSDWSTVTASSADPTDYDAMAKYFLVQAGYTDQDIADLASTFTG